MTIQMKCHIISSS